MKHLTSYFSKIILMQLLLWLVFLNAFSQKIYTPAKTPIEITTGFNAFINNDENYHIPGSIYVGLNINTPLQNDYYINFGLEYTRVNLHELQNEAPYYYDRNNFLKLKIMPQIGIQNFLKIGMGLQYSLSMFANRIVVDGTLPFGYSKESISPTSNSTLDFIAGLDFAGYKRVGFSINGAISVSNPQILGTIQIGARYAINGSTKTIKYSSQKQNANNGLDNKKETPIVQPEIDPSQNITLAHNKKGGKHFLSFSLGPSLPQGNFLKSDTVIGPNGNAVPGFYLSVSHDFQHKFAGWKTSAEFSVNPLSKNYQYQIELMNMYSTANSEIGNWKSLKFLTGPQFTLQVKQVTLQTSFMVGLLRMAYPNITIISNDKASEYKIQHEGHSNIMQQFDFSVFYPINKSIQLGVTAKYQYSNSQVKYLETAKSYHLGNIYAHSDGNMVTYRMNNTLPGNPPDFSGWIGKMRRERTLFQKYAALNIGFTIRVNIE